MQRTFVQHLVFSVLGASAIRAISFAAMPIAARMYTKEDFGGLALSIGFVGFVEPFVTLRYDVAIVLTRSARAARAIAIGLFGIALIGFTIVAMLIAVAPALLAPLMDAALVSMVRGPISLLLGASILSIILTALLQRQKRFGIIAASQLVGASVTTIWILSAPYIVGPSLVVLVWGYAAGALSRTAFLLIAFSTSLDLLLRELRRGRRMLAMLAKYRVYPIYTLPTELSALTADRLLLVYLASAFSVATLGGYFTMRQISAGLADVVIRSVRQVVFAHAAQGSSMLGSAKRVLGAIARGVGVGSGIVVGITWQYAGDLTRVILGDRWVDVSELLPWIMAYCAMNAVAAWHNRLLDVLGKQRLAAVLQMAGDVALVMTIGVMWLSSATLVFAVSTHSAVAILSDVIWLGVVCRYAGFGFKHALVPVFYLIIATLGAIAIDSALALLLGGSVGSGVSVCMLLMLIVATAALTMRAILRDTVVIQRS